MKEEMMKGVCQGEALAGTELPVKEMIDQAFEAMGKAYTPYSGFKVGAALLSADGTLYQAATSKMQPILQATVRNARHFF